MRGRGTCRGGRCRPLETTPLDVVFEYRQPDAQRFERLAAVLSFAVPLVRRATFFAIACRLLSTWPRSSREKIALDSTCFAIADSVSALSASSALCASRSRCPSSAAAVSRLSRLVDQRRVSASSARCASCSAAELGVLLRLVVEVRQRVGELAPRLLHQRDGLALAERRRHLLPPVDGLRDVDRHAVAVDLRSLCSVSVTASCCDPDSLTRRARCRARQSAAVDVEVDVELAVRRRARVIAASRSVVSIARAKRTRRRTTPRRRCSRSRSPAPPACAVHLLRGLREELGAEDAHRKICGRLKRAPRGVGAARRRRRSRAPRRRRLRRVQGASSALLASARLLLHVRAARRSMVRA